MEPSNALQNPYRKLKPGTITAANPKVIAFKINKNNPKVRIIKGKVKNVRMGSNIAFNTPKTAAEIAAFPKPSTSIPKNGNLEIIKKLTAVTNQVMMIPTIVIPFWFTVLAYRTLIVFLPCKKNVTQKWSSFSSFFL